VIVPDADVRAPRLAGPFDERFDAERAVRGKRISAQSSADAGLDRALVGTTAGFIAAHPSESRPRLVRVRLPDD
jgi:hypothetical protein